MQEASGGGSPRWRLVNAQLRPSEASCRPSSGARCSPTVSRKSRAHLPLSPGPRGVLHPLPLCCLPSVSESLNVRLCPVCVAATCFLMVTTVFSCVGCYRCCLADLCPNPSDTGCQIFSPYFKSHQLSVLLPRQPFRLTKTCLSPAMVTSCGHLSYLDHEPRRQGLGACF